MYYNDEEYLREMEEIRRKYGIDVNRSRSHRLSRKLVFLGLAGIFSMIIVLLFLI